MKYSYLNDDINIEIAINDSTLEGKVIIKMLCNTDPKINTELEINQTGDDVNLLLLSLKREVLIKVFNWKEAFKDKHTLSTKGYKTIKKLLFGTNKPTVSYIQTSLF